MFVKSKHYAGYIHKAKITLGHLLGEEVGGVTETFVTLREMTMSQKMGFQVVAKSGDGAAIFQAFQEALPRLVVDHNFYQDEGKPMDNAEVVDIIMEREAVAMFVLDEYKTRVMGFQSGETAPAKSGQ